MSTTSRQRNTKKPNQKRRFNANPGPDLHLIPQKLIRYTAENAPKVRGAFGQSAWQRYRNKFVT